jgi:predicted transcriptional regulator
MPEHELVPSELDLEIDDPPDAVCIGDDDVLDAISSSTARRILSVLRDGPAVKSAVASDADVSIQVVAYHLDRLESAGLVAVTGTTYSKKGRAMDVYALTTESIVVHLVEPPA